jgi:putative MATE family efflux protein
VVTGTLKFTMAENEQAVAGRLTTGSVGGHLTKMTIPTVWGILAIVAVSVTDVYFVAQLGTLPLAAMGFVVPIAMIMFSLGIGLAAGATSVVARAVGGSSHEQIQRLTTDSMSLTFIISSAFALIGILTIEPVFRLLGASDDTLPLITAYMVPWYIGVIFLIVPMVGNGAIRACGDGKWPGLIMMGSAGLNAILDPILIFGLLGAPRMEIAGAAWATLVARIFTLVASFSILYFRERLITSLWPGWQRFMQSGKELMHIAAPAAINQMLNPLATAALTAIVATYGAGAVAAFGVATRIEGLALVVLYALSAIIGPVAGQNWGAGLTARAREAVVLCFRFCVIFGVGGSIILFAVTPWITPLFDPDPHISGTADLYLRIVPWSYALHGAVMVSSAFFNGIGKPGRSLVLTIIRMMVLMVPLALIGSTLAGISGVFWAVAIANTASGLLAIVWSLKACALATGTGSAK